MPQLIHKSCYAATKPRCSSHCRTHCSCPCPAHNRRKCPSLPGPLCPWLRECGGPLRKQNLGVGNAVTVHSMTSSCSYSNLCCHVTHVWSCCCTAPNTTALYHPLTRFRPVAYQPQSTRPPICLPCWTGSAYVQSFRLGRAPIVQKSTDSSEQLQLVQKSSERYF